MSEEDYTTAEIVRSLKRIERKVDQITAGYVPRGEFDEYKRAIGTEIRDLKNARAPWWQVMSIGIACAALIVTLVVALQK